jgi:hypothetical protein
MKRLALATCTLGVLLVLANLGRSGEDKDLGAIINKALDAHGGEAKLAKYPAQTLKGAGKSYALGEAIDFTVEATSQADRNLRFAVDLKIMDQDVKIGAGVSGAKGWVKVNDDVKEMPADELAELKEQMHAGWVARLLPLKGKDYKLSSVGEDKVGDRPAVGVRVSKKGRRDVNLFFDKAKGHLVKSEYTVKDIKGGGTELTQTTFYSEYKDFQGTRHPTHLVIDRDGKKFSDTQVTEIQLLEKVDDSTFEQP